MDGTREGRSIEKEIVRPDHAHCRVLDNSHMMTYKSDVPCHTASDKPVQIASILGGRH